MILANASRYCMIAVMALPLAAVAVPAHADVLEIDAGEMRWVAGGPVAVVTGPAPVGGPSAADAAAAAGSLRPVTGSNSSSKTNNIVSTLVSSHHSSQRSTRQHTAKGEAISC